MNVQIFNLVFMCYQALHVLEMSNKGLNIPLMAPLENCVIIII